MSYMNHNAAFAPAGRIQELSFHEVEAVDGAVAQILVVAAVAASGLVAGVVVGLVIMAVVDYLY